MKDSAQLSLVDIYNNNSFFEVLNSKKLGILICDANGQVHHMNQALCHWCGHNFANETISVAQVLPQLENARVKIPDSEHFAPFEFALMTPELSHPIVLSAIQIKQSVLNDTHYLILCWHRRANTIESYQSLLPSFALQQVFDLAPIGIIHLNPEWECTYINDTFCKLTQLNHEELTGRGWTTLFQENDDDLHRLISGLINNGRAQLEINRPSCTKHTRVLLLELKAEFNKRGKLTFAVGGLTDISDRVNRENEIHRLANYDEVTGLYNRLALKHQLERYIQIANQLSQQVQVLFIDLDGFKAINDLYGHAVGDDVLKVTAKRLQKTIRQSDIAARLGGDEFVVLMPGALTKHIVDSIAKKLLFAIEQTIEIDDKELHVSGSIGIAQYIGAQNSEQSPETIREELLKQADLAMYNAKSLGKNRYCRFDVSHSNKLTRSFTIAQNLPQALKAFKVSYHYQPIIAHQSEQITFVEALVRWHHEELGELSAREIINTAESNGKILALQRYMLEMTISEFREIAYHSRFYNEQLGLCLNLSTTQLNEHSCMQEIIDLAGKYKIAPQQIMLEVSEETLHQDHDSLSHNLHTLKEAGFLLAIDDFGRNHSSLHSLSDFPFDYVKLDKAFIEHKQGLVNQSEMIDGIIHLCHQLNKKVVAEGVETSEQSQLLGQIHCDLYQGYLYCKPLKKEQLIAWISDYYDNKQARTGA